MIKNITEIEAPTYRKQIIEMLDDLKTNVMIGKTRAVIAVEIPTDVDADMLEYDAGDISYSQVIGCLEMAKIQMWAKSSGVIE